MLSPLPGAYVSLFTYLSLTPLSRKSCLTSLQAPLSKSSQPLVHAVRGGISLSFTGHLREDKSHVCGTHHLLPAWHTLGAGEIYVHEMSSYEFLSPNQHAFTNKVALLKGLGTEVRVLHTSALWGVLTDAKVEGLC